jgi:shikimate kinase
MTLSIPNQLPDLLKGTSIYLIGMMGSGKTTIAHILAQALQYRSFDTDALIEQASQQSVAEIFAESGEAVFRELETRTLEALAPMLRSMIATGGGIVLKPENWGFLRTGVIIWLDVSVEALHQRLLEDTTRPLLQNADLLERLQTLDSARRSIYAQADIHIPIDATETPEQICDRILQSLTQACLAKHQSDLETQRMNQDKPYQLN